MIEQRTRRSTQFATKTRPRKQLEVSFNMSNPPNRLPFLQAAIFETIRPMALNLVRGI